MGWFDVNRTFSFVRLMVTSVVLIFSMHSFAQSSEGGVKFLFECDSMQTTILADYSILISVTKVSDSNYLVAESYCSSKLITLEPGNYIISIVSEKFCNEEVHNIEVCPEKVTFVLLDLYRSSNTNCTSKKQYSSPVSISCG